MKRTYCTVALLLCAVAFAVLAWCPQPAYAAAYQSWDQKVVNSVEMGGDEPNIMLAHAACTVSYSRRKWHGDGYDGTKLWFAAFKKVLPNSKWVRACEINAAAIIRWSGVDTAFPIVHSSKTNWIKYAKQSDKWDYLGYWKDEDESKLLPGDILIHRSGNFHVCIYVGNEIVQDVYRAYVQGTDGDVGVPYDDAMYVSGHSGGSLTAKRSGAPSMDTAKTAYVRGVYKKGGYEIIRHKGAVSVEQSKKAIAARHTVADGVYTLPLKAKSSLKLSVSGASLKSGATAKLYSKNQRASQRWRLKFTSDGYYRIINVASGKSLTLVGDKATSSGKVTQAGWKGAKRQKWRVDVTKYGYRISSALDKKYSLGTSGGKKKNATTIRLYKNSKKKSLFWKLKLVKPSTADDTLLLTNAKSKKSLFAPLDASKPAKQVKTDANADSQQWRIAYEGTTGYYTVQNVRTGLYLTSKGQAKTKQSKLKARKFTQRWEIKKSGAAWVLRNASTGRVLAIANDSKKKNAKAALVRSAKAKTAKWNLVAAPKPPEPASDAPAKSAGSLVAAR